MTVAAKHDEKGGRIIGSYNGYHPAEYGKPDYEVVADVDDLTTLVDMSIRSLKRGAVRYPNTAEGLEFFKTSAISYLEYINEANGRTDCETRVFPDVEGLCMFLGISRKTLFMYERTRSEEWAEAIGLVKTAIATAKKQLSSTYKIPPVLAIFDLANNAGYKNVSEFKIEPLTDESKNKKIKLTDSILGRYKEKGEDL